MTTKTKKKTGRENGAKPVKLREIALLGYAEETRGGVFEVSEDTEIWGINAAHVFLDDKWQARCTDWFQMHPKNWVGANKKRTGFFGRPKEHIDFLQSFKGTVWTQERFPDIRGSKPYPIDKVSMAAGRKYFTSTFAYQLALIWYQHVLGQEVATVHLFGINLTSADEYIHQKPCVEYWIGRLEQLGIDVHVPEKSGLMKGKLYAYDGADLSDHANERLAWGREKYMEAYAEVTTASAAMLEVRHWAKFLGTLGKEDEGAFNDAAKAAIQERLNKRLANWGGLMDKASADLNGWSGMVRDNQHWLAITGGIDHRAGTLPQMRVASSHLVGDWEKPVPKAV